MKPMRYLVLAAVAASLAACTPAEQNKAENQAKAAAAEVKDAASKVANDPDIKAATSGAKEAAKTAGSELKEAAQEAGAKLKEAGAEAKQNADAADEKPKS